MELKVPTLAIIIGEGGSGGAIALAAADKVLMLENSIYSVISPEGCASILWRKEEYAEQASNSLKLTAYDLQKIKVIDKIIKEPLGGAHRDKEHTINSVGNNIEELLVQMKDFSRNEIGRERRNRYLNFGSNFKL